MAAAVTNSPKSLEDSSKKDKRGVAIFGVPGYDLFGGGAAFGGPGWSPTGFSSVGWGNPDSALGQIQLQATHNIALQVCGRYWTKILVSLASFFTAKYHFHRL